ncbi:RNA 2',3'-cyclic phosphodiesterase [Antarcticimicrobium luteum]|uniref:RNA 2',3'-cyclic phosphodiesterase n=1 Tax=Antarcticimicrobium luteum TaxID=2547397 RepID=A0A4R5UX29_9RHOB|nr:RNA 2',3'-cyclic phosphodiesterase [Antarcticimicrobium luteum]TDK43870.1 RNA 2',3'-cyclic phosphodiesterase [Antarcticimicrobium luteum]
MRAFIAIDLPEEVTAPLVRLQAGLPAGRPVAEENLHLTLAFLGDQEEVVLEGLHYELEGIKAPPFELCFSGLGTFGGNRPRILFADVAPESALTDLHRRVTGALRRAGMVPPRERFHPHVTLGRFGNGAAADVAARLRGFLAEHGDTPLPGFAVTGFGLYESTRHPSGVRYELLARYDLV